MAGEDNKASGTADDLKGKAKEALGSVTGDRETQTEGQGDQVKGNVKKAVGNVKDAVDDATR